ncbi:MAG: PEP-CTERM sorting domain-containing protein [Kiritimatiellales bacterium]|nr:PEP-CTERM sorting domain-containing protein [Kiritimatiellales bacterium]
MKKTTWIYLAVLLAGFATNSSADIVANLLQDPGFESLTGNAPDTTTTPWAAVEPTKFPISSVSGTSATQNYHSGSDAVVFQYYAISPTARFYQDVGTQIVAGKDYELSIWSLLGDKSANAAHTNSTTFNMAIYTSTTVDGTYTYRTGVFNLKPTAPDQWEQFTTTFTAENLSAWQGEYMRVAFTRPNNSVEYRLYFDDASFGEVSVIPEPATLGLVALIGLGLLAARRFMLM